MLREKFLFLAFAIATAAAAAGGACITESDHRLVARLVVVASGKVKAKMAAAENGRKHKFFILLAAG